MGNGHWAMGIGHWALGIKEVQVRSSVNKYDSFHAPCPFPINKIYATTSS
ncbi:hypothetical protein [Tolypothrix sp. VBCCA 56010]